MRQIALSVLIINFLAQPAAGMRAAAVGPDLFSACAVAPPPSQFTRNLQKPNPKAVEVDRTAAALERVLPPGDPLQAIWAPDRLEEELLRYEFDGHASREESLIELKEIVLEEIGAIRMILREAGHALSVDELLHQMRLRGLALCINDEDSAGRALVWLREQPEPGPRHHEGNSYQIDMDAQRWPPERRERWLAIRGEAPADAIARIDLLMQEWSLSWEDLVADPRDAGNLSDTANGYRKRAPPNEDWPREHNFEKFLERMGRVLGVDPVWLRTGRTREETLRELIPRLRAMETEGQRAYALRRAAGLSRWTVSKRSGLSVASLSAFEGRGGSFEDPWRWRELAQVLDVDPFLILKGMSRAETLPTVPLGERIRLLRLSLGLTQMELAGKLHRDATTIIACESGVLPPMELRQQLAGFFNIPYRDLFQVSVPSVEELLRQPIGARIRTLRESHGWTPNDLADLLGCTPRAVRRWENSQVVRLSLETRRAMAGFFGVPEEAMDIHRSTWEELAPLTHGERIERLRTERGWSLEELAGKVEVGPVSVWNWENLNRMPQPRQRGILSEAFGLPEEKLFSAPEPGPYPPPASSPGSPSGQDPRVEQSAEATVIVGTAPA